MRLLSSLSEISAGEGFSIVLLSGLQAFGALALIVGVLIVMDKVFRKKHPEWNDKSENGNEENTGENEKEGDKS